VQISSVSEDLISLLVSESVYLDSRFFDAILNKEIGDLASLVSLKLDDLTHLLIVNEGAIASEFLSAFVSVPVRIGQITDRCGVIPS
jgi:hypothetical protein